ncbi:MAG: hypothetical protein DYG89_26155 [Caldilinea sp. CFX5]|nr:hypothetical protein [Caldilinea sp. CFX5]
MPEKVSKLPNEQSLAQQEIDEVESLDELDEKLKRMRRLPRGAFLAEPGATTDPRRTKIRVTLYLDKDVLYYFKERAAQPNAAPYQTQINQELRTVMERDSAPTPTVDYMQLIQNKKFIAAIAEKVQEYTVNPEE